MKNKNCKFVAFDLAPDVCNNCGELATSHIETETNLSDFHRDMWRVLLEHGHIPSYYGGRDDTNTIVMWAHFHIPFKDPREWNAWAKELYANHKPAKPCELDFGKLNEVRQMQVAEFKDSFTDSSYYRAAIGGELRCVCGLYRGWGQKLVLENKTISQLIWLVVKKAEEKDK